MNSRRALLLSLAVNALLALAAGLLWHHRAAPPPPPAFAPPQTTAPDPAPAATTPPSPPPAPGPPPPGFHWAQVESGDYRRYIANLRALGCPERLIRDLIVSDLDALYESRRRALRPLRLDPWAGADRRRVANQEHQLARTALTEEQDAVTTELLGYPWQRDAIQQYAEEEIIWVLLGYLPDDKAIQVLGLPERFEQASRDIRQAAEDILLEEDRAALNEVAHRLEAAFAAVLNPAELDELMLRLHLIMSMVGDRHLEAADLTGAQLREVARISSRFTDPIREELIQAREVPEAEQDRRKAAMEAALAQALGPDKAADIQRAGDERFRDVLDFTRQHNLSRQTAIAAYDVRRAAEDEARALRNDAGLDPETRQARLQEVQAATAEAMTRLLGKAPMSIYLEEPGEWLNELGNAGAPEGSDE